MNLGAHMSIAGGVHLALRRGLDIGCGAVQLFVKSTNQWKVREYAEEEIALFRAEAARFKRGLILAHSSYLVNLASPDPVIRARSRRGFLDEMRLAELLAIGCIVIHPGSHRGSGEEAGVRTAAESLNMLLSQTHGWRVGVLIEITAGQGNSIGYSFEQLARMLEMVEDRERLGVCFDTCHAFAAGYDFRARHSYVRTFRLFDEIIGLDRLKAFHLNDSLRPLGSRIDRHTHIGTGTIGLGAFSLLVNDRRFSSLPMILETPKGIDMKEDIKNLAVLRGLRKHHRASERGKPMRA